MGVFGAITSAVNHAWGVERNYGFFKHKLIAFVMLLAAGLLLLAALALERLAQMAQARWFAGVMQRLAVALSTLTGLLYRSAADAGRSSSSSASSTTSRRTRRCGCATSGSARSWPACCGASRSRGSPGTCGISSRFSVHGSIAAVVAFLVWVYLSAVILLYGVEVTAAYARLRKHLPDGGVDGRRNSAGLTETR